MSCVYSRGTVNELTDSSTWFDTGDRIGMIRFGSRADVYYENYKPLVKVGQTAISGETLLAKN